MQAGRPVLHLGCSDYPYSLEQYKQGNLLHDKLHRVSKNLAGVDVSTEGIDYLSSLGFENLVVGNVENLKDAGIVGTFEVIIAGELLEHVENVGKCLENIHCLMDKESILVVSVPNAHSVKSFVRVFLGSELVHPDHLYYFSPATMEHLCKRFSYEVMDYFYWVGEPKGILKKVLFCNVRLMMKYMLPYVADGLLFILRKMN